MAGLYPCRQHGYKLTLASKRKCAARACVRARVPLVPRLKENIVSKLALQSFPSLFQQPEADMPAGCWGTMTGMSTVHRYWPIWLKPASRFKFTPLQHWQPAIQEPVQVTQVWSTGDTKQP